MLDEDDPGFNMAEYDGGPDILIVVTKWFWRLVLFIGGKYKQYLKKKKKTVGKNKKGIIK